MKGMAAVNLPSVSSASLDAGMQGVGESMFMSHSEEQSQSLSQESMDQIRSTMLQHEELFKEQVQALHKLYNVQKSAMQEIRKLICTPAQMSASNFDAHEARYGQSHSSLVAGKPLWATPVRGQDYMETSHVLSTSPISVIMESSRSDSWKAFSTNNMKTMIPPNIQNKLSRDIDLERPPEEYMDESDYKRESNNSDIQDANGSSYPFMGCHEQVLQTGFYGRPLKSSQENGQDLRSKIHVKCNSAIQSLQETLRCNRLEDFPWNHLPAVGNLSINGESNVSVNQCERKPSWLLQQLTPFAAQRLSSSCKSVLFESKELHPERKTNEQVKSCSLLPNNAYIPGSVELDQSLKSKTNITVPYLMDKQPQRDFSACLPCSEASHTSNPAVQPQAPSTPKPMISDSKAPNGMCIRGVHFLEKKLNSEDHNPSSFLSRTGNNDGDENPYRSGHGSNSPVSEQEKAYGDGDSSSVAVKSTGCGSNRLPVQDGHVEVGSEPKEAHQFRSGDINPSHSLSIQVEASAACQRDGGEASVTKGNDEELGNESTAEEACESIAAKILLSFALCRSQSNEAKRQCLETQMEMETNRTSRDSGGGSNIHNRFVKKGRNNSNGVGVDAVKWTKSVCRRRRRPSRRQR